MEESALNFLKLLGTSAVGLIAGVFAAGVLFAKKVAKLDSIAAELKTNTANDVLRQAQVEDLKERMIASEIYSKAHQKSYDEMKKEFNGLRNDLRDWMAK